MHMRTSCVVRFFLQYTMKTRICLHSRDGSEYTIFRDEYDDCVDYDYDADYDCDVVVEQVDADAGEVKGEYEDEDDDDDDDDDGDHDNANARSTDYVDDGGSVMTRIQIKETQ